MKLAHRHRYEGVAAMSLRVRALLVLPSLVLAARPASSCSAFGCLADDQLGYLIAPTEGVPAAAEKTALTGNDNFLFNVAPTIGDHVMCTAITLALDVGFPGDPLRDPRCATWLGEPDVNPTTQLPN